MVVRALTPSWTGKKLLLVINTALMNNHQAELAEAMADKKYCQQTSVQHAPERAETGIICSRTHSPLSTLFLTWWTPSRAWWRFPRSNRAGSELMHGCLLTCFFNCNRSPVFTGASGVRVHDVDHVDKRPYDGHSDGRRGQLRGARLGQLHELDEVGVSDGVVAGRGQQLLFLAEG